MKALHKKRPSLNVIKSINFEKQSNFSFNKNRRLALPILKGFLIIPFENIMYLQSSNNYTNIFLLNGDKHCISKNMGYIEKQLDNQFYRTHNSYIVNLKMIRSFNVSDKKLHLGESIYVPVSRSKSSDLIGLFKGE
ncbi:LytTR family transcriptional regulator [Saprospiraceae bacterium]|nr:LytTR family transcriptional regulator [Saprospiraceae bacterium]